MGFWEATRRSRDRGGRSVIAIAIAYEGTTNEEDRGSPRMGKSDRKADGRRLGGECGVVGGSIGHRRVSADRSADR